MTREDALEELKEIRFNLNYKVNGTSRFDKALNMAIKLLEQEPCDDAISRQAVIDTIDKWIKSMHVLIALPANEVTPLFESVHELPPVTPQPKMGYWEWKPHPVLPYTGNWYCSECHLIGSTVYDYCPSCGAKMQEVEE